MYAARRPALEMPRAQRPKRTQNQETLRCPLYMRLPDALYMRRIAHMGLRAPKPIPLRLKIICVCAPRSRRSPSCPPPPSHQSSISPTAILYAQSDAQRLDMFPNCASRARIICSVAARVSSMPGWPLVVAAGKSANCWRRKLTSSMTFCNAPSL